MQRVDVYVWMDNDDYAVAAASLRSLKKHLSADVASWFLVGKRGDKLERLGYDQGARILPKPALFSELGDLMLANGDAGRVVVWSSLAVLLADWEPWQRDQSRVWANCPTTVLFRDDLSRWAAQVDTWPQAQALGNDHQVLLKETQVKVLPLEEYEKALKGPGWGFGPTVLILETGALPR